MTQSHTAARRLLAGAVWLACVAAPAVAGAQTPATKTAATPARGETYVSAVSAGIPAAADKPAAVVNGEMISMAELKALLETRPYPNAMPADQIKALRQAAVDMLVDDVLMRQFLAKNAPKVNPADVAKEMQAVQDYLKKEHKTLVDFLKETGQSQEQLQKDVAARLQWRGYLHARLPEEQAKKYYEDNKPFFDKVLVRASHVLVKVPAAATAEQKQLLYNKAEAIRQEILQGKLTFEAAAKKYSECPSRDKGGDLGPFPFKFVVVEPFARAAFAMKINEVSGVVATEFGYHVIKVTDRTQPKEVTTYEAVREAVREVWAQDVELYQQIIAHQRKNGKVEVMVQ